jgi:hypothetical protein
MFAIPEIVGWGEWLELDWKAELERTEMAAGMTVRGSPIWAAEAATVTISVHC